MPPLPFIFQIIAIGVIATAFMDIWVLWLKRQGVPTLQFALLGRWIAHCARGHVFHPAIAKAAPVQGELALGWAMHYATGVAFAVPWAMVLGPQWLQQPTLAPALAWGIATVAFPLLVMQPAMGSGLAARRTPTPWKNRLRSLANHAVFGLGLYASAWLVSMASRLSLEFA